jgi:tryptophanyl-tRNA synthetase
LRFNGKYGETFKVPEPVIGEYGARLRALQDPDKKMYKSDPNPFSYISLGDTPDTIVKKVRRAVTDSGREVVYAPEEKPALANLLEIYSLCAGMDIPAVERLYAGKGYGDFKDGLAEVLIETLSPIQAKFKALKESGDIYAILREGALYANSVACQTLSRAKEKTWVSGCLTRRSGF